MLVYSRKWFLDHWVAIVTGVIVVLIFALLTLAITQTRRDAIAQARLKVSYLAAALEEEAEKKLDTLDIASEFVKRRIEGEEDAPLAEIKSEISSVLPGLGGILIIGPDGGLRATSGDVASVPSSFSQFDFFSINRDNSSAGLRLGQPVNGLLPNRAALPATQRLEKKGGEFAGVLVFLLDTARATEMYRRVDLGNCGSLMLLNARGILIAGYTLPRGLDPSLIGTLATTEKTAALRQSATSGTYIARSTLDGIERIHAWRRLANFPVVAVVGLGKAEALAAANRQAMHMLALGVLSAGFVVILTIMLSREMSRRTKQALALEEANTQLAAACVDITERKRHEEQIDLLLREVNHRSKNMLTVVQSIARQTVAANSEEFIERFAERIQALAASQDLLVKNAWRGADLDELARSQLGHFKDLVDKRIELRGPPLLVSASAAQTIGMALHELATNAGKYGALSNDGGRVELVWSLEPREGGGETFTITWREFGGPAVKAPARGGFGTTVLCRVARESLDAQVELNFAPTGLVWRMRCPAAEVVDHGWSAR